LSGWKKPDESAQRHDQLPVVDAESVKNTDSAEHKGYGAGEKVHGNKRHISIDTQGLPMPSPRLQPT
jgi:hypothetical protein